MPSAILILALAAVVSPSLPQQADDLAAFARTEYLAHRGGWPADFANTYAEAVKQGVLDGAKEPLSDAKMAELRAVVRHECLEKAAQPSASVYRVLRAKSMRYAMAETVTWPVLTAADREKIHVQIRKLAEFLEHRIWQVVRDPIIRHARARGKTVTLPASVPKEAGHRFELWALKTLKEPWNGTFKHPLSAKERAAIQHSFLHRTRNGPEHLPRASTSPTKTYRAGAQELERTLMLVVIDEYSASARPIPRDLREAISKAVEADRKRHGHP